jgi:hypothetical protein
MELNIKKELEIELKNELKVAEENLAKFLLEYQNLKSPYGIFPAKWVSNPFFEVFFYLLFALFLCVFLFVDIPNNISLLQLDITPAQIEITKNYFFIFFKVWAGIMSLLFLLCGQFVTTLNVRKHQIKKAQNLLESYIHQIRADIDKIKDKQKSLESIYLQYQIKSMNRKNTA